MTTMSGVVSESVRDEERDALRRALLRTVAYADIFDYPLDRDQIHRYLIGHEASRASIEEMLDRDDTLRGRIQCTDGLFHLRGRGGIVATRRRRAETSARLWTVARRWVMAIAWLPLVRSVAITGALAMDNAEPDSDIDLFILTQPGRLWLCRLLVLVLVRVAHVRGVRLCPNFLLSTDRLVLSERNLFTAHEIAQTISVTSSAWSDEFREANHWSAAFLPNARDARAAPLLSSQPLAARLASRVLAAPAFDRVERWEMQRKIKRLLARAGRDGGSVAFSKDECRGHFAAHDVRVLAEFSARVARLEASP